MNTYIIQRPERVFKLYYKNGTLYKLEGDPDLGDKFWTWFYKNKMDSEANIANYKSDNIKVELMKVNFEMFWNRYGKKVKMDRAKKEWAKLKEHEQLLAYNGIAKYQKYKGGHGQIAIVYPDQYLKDKRWEDED